MSLYYGRLRRYVNRINYERRHVIIIIIIIVSLQRQCSSSGGALDGLVLFVFAVYHDDHIDATHYILDDVYMYIVIFVYVDRRDVLFIRRVWGRGVW